jgi:hypothetical protein
MLDFYLYAFAHLKPPRDRKQWSSVYRNAPLKALLLLAISDLIAEGVIRENYIERDAVLAGRFAQYWNAVTGMRGHLACLESAFAELADDRFWHLRDEQRDRGTVGNVLARIFRPHVTQRAATASLDGALFGFLQQAVSRSQLQRTLLETYVPRALQGRLALARLASARQERKMIGGDAGSQKEADSGTRASDVDGASPGDGEAERSEHHLDACTKDAQFMAGYVSDAPLGEEQCKGETAPLYSGKAAANLSAIFIEPQVASQAVFAGPDAYPLELELRTPAGTRRVLVARQAMEGMPLVAGHLRERLRSAGYDFGADWLFALDLLVRTGNVLLRHEIRTMGALAEQTVGDLIALRNFGSGSLGEVIEVLRSELWPHLAHLTLDELVPLSPVEQTRAQHTSALLADVEAVLAAPHAYGPLLSEPVVAGLCAVGCDVDRMAVRVMLLWGDGSDPGDERPATWAANVLSREGFETVGAVVRRSPSELLGMRQFGATCYRMLCKRLRVSLAPWLKRLPSETFAAGAAEDAETSADEADAESIQWAGVAADSAASRAQEERPQTIFDRLRAALTLMTEAATQPDANLHDVGAATALLDGLSVAGLLDELKVRMEPGARAHSQAARRGFDVLLERAGVFNGQGKTLAELGEQWHLTRERIRQLEQRALGRLMDPAVKPDATAMGNLANLAVMRLGGVARVVDVAEWIARLVLFGSLDPVCTVRLMASWSTLREIEGDRLALSVCTDALIECAETAISETLKAHPGGLAFDDFVWRAQQAGGDALSRVQPAFVAAVVRSSMQVEVVDGECRPAGHGSLKARIIAALRRLERPAHFTEIAASYRQLNPDDLERTDNTVHAFICRFPEVFVLVGLGTFALAEWGYDPAIRDVASVVREVLLKAGRPLHRDEVVRLVGERYRWKANSIIAALATDKYIQAFGNALFGLKQSDYGPVAPQAAYTELLGVRKSVRTAIVKGVYTNERGSTVTHLRLTPPMLHGQIVLSNKQVRDCFAEVGDVGALCCGPSGAATTVTIHRNNSAVTGLGRWFAALGVQVGDGLLIERLGDAAPGEPCYLLVHAPEAHEAEALRLAGVQPNDREGEALGDVAHLLSVRNLDAVRQLVWHALEHPWTEISSVQAVLGLVGTGTQGSEYHRLGVRCGVLSDGQVPGRGDGLVFRPTRWGRTWAAGERAGRDAATIQRELALSLLPYRRHLRGITARGKQAITPLSPLVEATWDQRLGLAPGDSESRIALESTAAFIVARQVRRSALVLLLLLLAAQSHGLGVAPEALALDDVAEAIEHLRAHGIALLTDAAGRAALDERVTLGVDDVHALETRLRGFKSPIAGALADAWCAIAPSVARAGKARAEDFSVALQAVAPELLQEMLTTPPEAVSDTARYGEGAFVACDFPLLVGDFGWSREQITAPFAFWHDADARARDPLRAPLGICLGVDLMRWPWTAPQHLGANAHLALLTVLASDLGGLAEHLHRGDTGWELSAEPLVIGLDRALRALGYDIWDEHYRDDPEALDALGNALVALGERLGLLRSEGPSVAAVGSLASDVYYSVYYTEQDLLGQVRAALAQALVP